MKQRQSDDSLEPIEGSATGPGSDPGAAYERAIEEAAPMDDDEEDAGSDVGDVYRSGS